MPVFGIQLIKYLKQINVLHLVNAKLIKINTAINQSCLLICNFGHNGPNTSSDIKGKDTYHLMLHIALSSRHVL